MSVAPRSGENDIDASWLPARVAHVDARELAACIVATDYAACRNNLDYEPRTRLAEKPPAPMMS
ncbi:MAG: hypothetical protein PF636_02370 [Actinomycetota bacterium]|jgi:hypothetical protein|nr:hypothetical protein [Actinomycetota bacterium]